MKKVYFLLLILQCVSSSFVWSQGDEPYLGAILFEPRINYINFTAEEKKKVEDALKVVKSIIQSKELRRSIASFTFQGTKQFAQNGGLTNMQIYSKIIEGAEVLNPEENWAMDLELELYRDRSSTVGYTYPDTMRVWVNRKYFDTFSSAEIAGNIFHEWMHKIGFEHDRKSTARRPYSVPYGLGYLIRDLAIDDDVKSHFMNSIQCFSR
jgi:hypothetical protein